MIIPIEQLKKLIIRYDRANGLYPESDYEGLSVYLFICEELNIEPNLEYYPEQKYIELMKENN